MKEAYGFDMLYRPVATHLVGDTPDERPVDKLPQVFVGWFDSETEREQMIAKLVADYETPRQGYRVERIVRRTVCGRCTGRGEVLLNPKGWRKKTPPPWHLCRLVTCPDCAGRPVLSVEQTDCFAATVEPAGAFGEARRG